MVRAMAAIFSTSATYSLRTPGRKRERKTVTIMAAVPLRATGLGRRILARRCSLGREAWLFCRCFDRLHIGIGEAEMVADFVHQHVFDDVAQRFVVFGPVIKDRPPV